ncbi:arrestin domain-containing protein [Blastomyces dermatitidis ATCC 18188]|uniref:Arrestin domain-containing protein n=1 Tax=Ajellomyces dermatitidis (strain ATCC 18188 / CBS 674.68) TaxID=653446 RepID=F2TKB0_AJEDA|nr:arrestin domain-containing protein [Blastomyces dermatitidis ATCC 18188]
MATSVTARSSNDFDTLSLRSKPSVIISLKNQQGSPINSYTTLDKIEGEVSVTSDYDVCFTNLSISFEGTSRTVIESPGMSGPAIGRYSAFHTFLRLVQPIDEQQYPQAGIISAGQTYTFPFTFVVPKHLLPNSCNHKCNHPQVHAEHILLPPSLSDPTISGNGGTLLDDMTPQMTQIQYAVRAQVFKASPVDASLKVLVDTRQKVRVIPAVDQAPPLSVLDDSEEYRMRKEKDVKRGALRGKIGRIVMAAGQPKAIPVPASAATQSAESTPSTMVTLHLRFDPTDENQQPPRLSRVWTRLKVNTFFSAEPWADIPTKNTSLMWALNRGVYTDTVSLASRCVASAKWKKHTGTSPCPSAASSLHRRDSFQSTNSVESLVGPSAEYAGETYYTAAILVPISLPPTRAYVPTFHSCLSSRTYALEISLSYNTPSASLTVPTLAVRVPVQISTTESLAEASAARGTPERSRNRNTGDEFFTPRSIAPPQVHFAERSSALSTEPGRGRSDTVLSTESTLSMAPPEYSNASSPLARRRSNPTIVRAAC